MALALVVFGLFVASTLLIQAAFISTAFMIMAWVFYDKSRVEIKIPDVLKRRQFLSFGEIADGLEGVPNLGYTRNELMHRLLKATWRGDFESAFGRSHLTYPEPSSSSTYVGGKWYPLEEQADEDAEKDVKDGSRMIPWTRRMLLSGWNMGIQNFYPSLDQIRDELRDNAVPWRAVKVKVKFGLLEKISPENYDDIFMNTYVERLTMSRRSFVRWFRRMLDGRYDRDPNW